MTLDFLAIAELPGRKVGQDQLRVICRRYAFARQFVEAKRVLEVGCGGGLGLGLLARKARFLAAGDVMAACVAQAQTTYQGRHDVKLLQLDAHALPFHDRAFDVVLGMAMIYYVHLEVFLRECRRVLRPSGTLLFCTPNKEAPGFRPGRLSTAYYGAPELAAALRRHGFDVEIFGAFRAPQGKAKLKQQLIAVGGGILNLVAFAPALRDHLRRLISRAVGYRLSTLDGELTEAHMRLVGDIELVALPCHSSNSTHRVLYVLAREQPHSSHQ